MHLENPPVPVRPRLYYFTILLFYYFTNFTGNQEFASRKPNLACRTRIPLIIQRKFLPVSLLLIGFPPRPQQFASRKPTCAGPTQILLFYYFTNFTGNREFASRKPTCAGWTQKLPLSSFRAKSRENSSLSLSLSLFTLIGFPPRPQQFASRKPTCAGPTQILLFYYFTILLFYYFTILLFYYFTILLFCYFTILLFY